MRLLPKIDESNARWWVLFATAGSLAIVLLDETVVGVALPTIRDDLDMTQLESHWIVNAYVLALAAFVAAGGRLGDIIGLRTVFVGGAVVFGLGSIASGAAQSGEWIIVSRVVQGIGAAGMWSTGVGMTASVFSPGQRGRAFAYYAYGGTLALAVGPFVGGLLTDVASWRWIFFLNIPIVIAVVTAITIAWREPERTAPRPGFDFVGLVVSSAFLISLVLGLMQAPNWGWGSTPALALFALAAVTLPLFVWREARAEAPLIDVRLLKIPTVIASNVSLGAAQFSKMAVIVFGALYLQDVLGFSPLGAGAALLVATAAVTLTVVASGKLTDSMGPRFPTLMGIVITTAGLVWLTALAPEESFPLLVPGFALWGAGLTFFFTPTRAAAMNSVPEEKHGEVGGVLTTSQMLGGTLGISVLGALLVGSGSYAALFGVTAGVTAATWILDFLLMKRPPTDGRGVPPHAWAHSLVALPHRLGAAVTNWESRRSQVGERSEH